MLSRILEIFERLFKPRTLFTFMFFGTFCYLVLTQLTVPPVLNSIISGLLGYYYGEKMAKLKGKEK